MQRSIISLTGLLLVCFFLLGSQSAAKASFFDKSKTPTASSEDTAKVTTVYELLKSHKELSAFVDLIDDADLKDLFRSSTDTITVFAPTDDAINDVSRDVMKRIKSSKENLQSFVKYHVVAGSRISSGAINGRKSSPASANGDSIIIDGTNSKDPAKINGGHLLLTDMSAGPSIVHTVSAALIPISLREEAKKEDQPKTPSVQAPVAPTAPVVPTVTAPVAAAPVVATPVISVPSAPGVPVGSSNSLSTSRALGTSKMIPISSSKMIPISSSMPMGTASMQLGTTTSVPVSTTLPTGSSAAIPSSQDMSGGTQLKAKGFTLFGHTFGN